MSEWEFIITTLKEIVFQGLPVSLEIVFFTLLFSMPIGFLVGLVRFKKIKIVNELLMIILSFFKGTPLIVLIFIFYNGVPSALNQLAEAEGWSINFFKINVMVYAIMVCSTFSIALFTEIFRSALASVDPCQLEAAHSVGLNSFQAYTRIIIPQALVAAIPNLGNDIINLFKGTSLIFYMGIQDIMGVAKANAGVSYRYVEAYCDVFIVYVVVCYIMQKIFLVLERKLNVYNGV